MPILETKHLEAFYGDFQALFGIDFAIEPGEVVAIIGANGAGKSTFLRALTGLNRSIKGEIIFSGHPILGLGADRISRMGLALVPEGRLLFRSLSVEENLRMGEVTGRKGHWTLERIYDLFPVLKELRHSPSHRLSGGQQQMTSIGRALMTNPDLLLCDEISLGLAPKIVRSIYGCFSQIQEAGTAIVLVEQNVMQATEAADRFYCFLEGRISLTGSTENVSMEAISDAYFGLHAEGTGA